MSTIATPLTRRPSKPCSSGTLPTHSGMVHRVLCLFGHYVLEICVDVYIPFRTFYPHTLILSHTHTLILSHTHTHSLAHTHTHSFSLSHIHTLILSLPHTLILSLPHTLILSLPHTPILSLTHTQDLLVFLLCWCHALPYVLYPGALLGAPKLSTLLHCQHRLILLWKESHLVELGR